MATSPTEPSDASEADSVPDAFLQVYLTNVFGNEVVADSAPQPAAAGSAQPEPPERKNWGTSTGIPTDAAAASSARPHLAGIPAQHGAPETSKVVLQDATADDSARQHPASPPTDSTTPAVQSWGTRETPQAFLERKLPVLQNLLLDRLLQDEIQSQEQRQHAAASSPAADSAGTYMVSRVRLGRTGSTACESPWVQLTHPEPQSGPNCEAPASYSSAAETSAVTPWGQLPPWYDRSEWQDPRWRGRFTGRRQYEELTYGVFRPRKSHKADQRHNQ